MSFRFWRRIRIAPGVTLNLSKTGGSLSFGVPACASHADRRGAHFTVGPHGRRVTAGIPGTGLFYTNTLSGNNRGRGTRATSSGSVVATRNRLTMGFFKRLATPDDEEALVDGCRELALGDEEKAFDHLKQAVHLADGAYLAGFMALKMERIEEAERFLSSAARDYEKLGRHFNKYGISAELMLRITGEVSAHIACNREGVLLGLVEVYQRQGRMDDAMHCLETLRRLHPDDVVVCLSLCELLLERDGDTKDAAKHVVHLTQGVENESPIHAALLLYKARALRVLGLAEAAKEALTVALRRRKGRSDELLHALRYERAMAYEDIGRKSQARADLGRIYAEAPDYADVAKRLNL